MYHRKRIAAAGQNNERNTNSRDVKIYGLKKTASAKSDSITGH
jgi:uncharacterized protein YihD (DUF1040 family)